MSFDIILSAESEEFIKKCDKEVRNRILKSLRKLKDEPVDVNFNGHVECENWGP